jgi:hypothetical protein
MIFSASVFFHESFSPMPLNNLLGIFKSFIQICGDIQKERFLTVPKHSNSEKKF